MLPNTFNGKSKVILDLGKVFFRHFNGIVYFET